jgi:hypothetical protein
VTSPDRDRREIGARARPAVSAGENAPDDPARGSSGSRDVSEVHGVSVGMEFHGENCRPMCVVG